MKMHPRFEITQRAEIEYGNYLVNEYLTQEQDLGWFYVIEQLSRAVAALAAEADGRRTVMFSNEPLVAMNKLRRKHKLTVSEALRIMHGSFTSWFNYPVRVERHGDREDVRADEA